MSRVITSVTEVTDMDPKDRYDFDDALSTVADGRDRGKSLEDNNTNSLQSLSHLDPPIDPGYMICGVVIAMALVGVIIIVLAVTISKLRKREDHHSEHPEQTVVQTATDNNLSNNNNQTVLADSIIPPDSNHAYTNNAYTATTTSEQFVWQFPPPYPPPRINPSQYALYNEQVHALSTDRPGFVKGFRKNLGGRWRRLVKRKPEMESCAIPPELKDQLKTIYVY